MQVSPVGAQIMCVRIEDKDQTKNGIFLPDKAKEKPQVHKIIELGPGGTDKDGNEIVFKVKPGDMVLTTKVCGTEVSVGAVKYRMIEHHDIIAILED